MEYWIVLLAALFHAIWNGMIKSSGDKLMALTMIRIVGFVFGVILVLTQPAMDSSLFPLVFAATSIHFIYFYCLINAYKLGDFSQVYPISRGLAPMIVLIIGLLFLGEQLTYFELSGTLLICAGVLTLAFFAGKPQCKPLVFAFATAACIAAYTLVSGVAVRIADSIWSYIGWLEMVTGLSVILFSLQRRKHDMLRHVQANIAVGLTAGILSICAFVASLWAISRVPMAPIAALRETSIIFAVLISVIFLKERFALNRLVASLLVVLGIGFLVIA